MWQTLFRSRCSVQFGAVLSGTTQVLGVFTSYASFSMTDDMASNWMPWTAGCFRRSSTEKPNGSDKQLLEAKPKGEPQRFDLAMVFHFCVTNLMSQGLFKQFKHCMSHLPSSSHETNAFEGKWAPWRLNAVFFHTSLTTKWKAVKSQADKQKYSSVKPTIFILNGCLDNATHVLGIVTFNKKSQSSLSIEHQHHKFHVLLETASQCILCILEQVGLISWGSTQTLQTKKAICNLRGKYMEIFQQSSLKNG